MSRRSRWLSPPSRVTRARVLPDTAVSVKMLGGDVTGDKTVNNSDAALTKGQIGMPITLADFREDANVSGAITTADRRLVKSLAGHSLP